MTRPGNPAPAWSDAELTDAVAASANWRDVMRALGLRADSAGTIRIVRRHVVRLGLDTSHFRGRRSWSDVALKRAVSEAWSWDEVVAALGLSPVSGEVRTRVRAHAIRLGLDLTRLDNFAAPGSDRSEMKPHVRYLRAAAASIAASWFSLCGLTVAFPVEPAVYDLLVSMPGGIKRIQVKTTTCRSRDGWMVKVGRTPYSAGNREPAVPYDPDLIDWFFVVDGDLTIYLIPSRVIAGRVRILLRAYTRYIVSSAAGLVAPPWDTAPAGGGVD